MSEKGPQVPPLERGEGEKPELSSIWDKAEYVSSLLPPDIKSRVDMGPTNAFKYYDSKEEADQAAAQAPILFFDHIASSVHLRFDDGEILEIDPMQHFGEIKPGTDSKTPVEFTMAAEHELAPELVQELMALAERIPYITETKVVYYQSDQKLIPPE